MIEKINVFFRTILCMKAIVPLFCGIIISFSGVAQKDEQPVPFLFHSHIDIFSSPKEKSLLTGTTSPAFNYLELYLQTAGQTEMGIADSKVSSFVSKISRPSQSFSSKDLKKLYKEIHDAFFSKYVENPAFNEIFVNGNYNCLTASALYALILEKLSIGYSIRETPDHVYIIADPGSANVVFETTAPGAKSLQITDKFKSQFLEYLSNNKLITAQEAASDKNAVFEKYFYADEKISLKQLAGLMYYNMGIDAFMKEDYSLAHKNFEKAYMLYPSKRTKYLVAASLMSILYQTGMEKNDNAWLYCLRYHELIGSEFSAELLKDFWKSSIQKLLFKSPQPAKLQLIYREMMPSISDTTLKKEMRSDYYYHTAHYFDIKNKYDSSLVYIDSVYTLTPDDLLVQELITGLIGQTVRSMPPDDITTLDTLHHFFNRYSFLDRHGKLGEGYMYCLAAVTAKLYDKDKKKEGDQYYAIIYDMMVNQPTVFKKYELYLTNALVQIYVYYVRNKQYKEAKKYVESVLKHIPNNEEMILRLKRINEILEVRN